jgi:hypothetical protein
VNEISISAVTGLSPNVQLYNGATPVGSPIPCVEIGTTGEYVGDMPAGLPFGRYLAVAYVGTDVKIASGEILWDGNYEVIQGMAIIQGLDPAKPSTTTPTNWDAGDIHIEISGDGVTETTMQRV